jgi:nucleoside-diphosphate-sugar epimerase
MVMGIARKRMTLKHIPGPLGVRGRNSDNRLIGEALGWRPSRTLREGVEPTYRWILEQVRSGSR